MVRKWAGRVIILYILYLALMYWYIFFGSDTSIPEALRGTAADPSTFLNGRELKLSEEYSGLRNFLFFLSTPYEWLIYFFILIFGVSRFLERSASSISKRMPFQTAIYLFWFSIISFIAVFPLNFLGYRISRSYHISTQSFTSWMKDKIIDYWVNFGTMFIIVLVLYWLIRKSAKKWWLYAWILSIPFVLFLMFVQPVLIDPLYNDFYPLKNKELETEILELADEADIPANHVYEVNMAEKTNSLNAYVTGIGANSRIVLWDTTLNTLGEDEILFIMAHEMAHYVEKHIYFGIAGYLAMIFVGLWLTQKLMNGIIRRWGRILKIPSISSISSLPLFLLLTSVLLFLSSPLSNYVSRYEELRADRYAIEMTKDQDPAISAFQELTRSGLSQVNPPLLVKWLRYTHPTMLERISTVENTDISKD